MWCRHCKQDVPAVAPNANGAVQCARCQRSLHDPPKSSAVSDAGVALDDQSETIQDPVRMLENEAAQPTFNEIRRSIRSAQRYAATAPRMLRFDPPESLVDPGRTQTAPSTGDASPPGEASPPSRGGQWVAWMTALLGATTLGVGVGLMFWSLTDARPELWNWGVGATLGGQGLLILGLLQLLASLWGANREAANTLSGVQRELRRLGRTTESLIGAKNQSAATFYADLARGASPPVLLANLKSQVDALSDHVAKE